MCFHKQTDNCGLLKCGTEAEQIMEGFLLQQQILLCSAKPCWDLDVQNVATDKDHKKRKNANIWLAFYGLCL